MNRDDALRRFATEHAAGLVKLQDYAVRARLIGGGELAPANLFEPDGRRVQKAVRLAIDAGLVAESDPGDPEATWRLALNCDAILETVAVVPFSLTEAWEAAFQADVPRTHEPLVRVLHDPRCVLSCGQVRALLLAPGVRWYLYDACKWDFGYGHGAASRFKESIRGPFTVDELPAAYGSYLDEHGTRIGRPGVAAATDRLAAHAADRVFRARVEAALPRNLRWGLETLGLLDEAEAERLPSDLGVPSPFPIPGGSKSGPEAWPANIERLVDHLHGEIEEAGRQLRLLEKVRRGVAARGGWEAFLAEYRAAAMAALREEDGKGTDAEPD